MATWVSYGVPERSATAGASVLPGHVRWALASGFLVANAARVVPVLALAGVGTGLVLSWRAVRGDD